jgi:hypothetical protein
MRQTTHLKSRKKGTRRPALSIHVLYDVGVQVVVDEIWNMRSMSLRLEHCQMTLFDDFVAIARREDVIIDNVRIDAVCKIYLGCRGGDGTVDTF